MQYYRKNVYGNELIYFVDPKFAQHFKNLTGRKTATSRDLAILSEMGMTFTETIQPSGKS